MDETVRNELRSAARLVQRSRDLAQGTIAHHGKKRERLEAEVVDLRGAVDHLSYAIALALGDASAVDLHSDEDELVQAVGGHDVTRRQADEAEREHQARALERLDGPASHMGQPGAGLSDVTRAVEEGEEQDELLASDARLYGFSVVDADGKRVDPRSCSPVAAEGLRAAAARGATLPMPLATHEAKLTVEPEQDEIVRYHAGRPAPVVSWRRSGIATASGAEKADDVLARNAETGELAWFDREYWDRLVQIGRANP